MPDWLRRDSSKIYDRRPDGWEVGGNNHHRDAGGTWLSMGLKETAEEFGVSHTIIRRIWNEEAWVHATVGVPS